MKKILITVIGIAVVLGVIMVVRSYPAQVTRPQQSQAKLHIATSFYPLYYLASEITGEYADVTNLTPGGAEPHEYELTPGDIVRIQKSDLLLTLGGSFEPWKDKLQDTLRENKIQAVAVGEELRDREMVEEGATIRDPHIWLSPKLAKKIAQSLEKILEQHDPTHAAAYQKNLADLERRLDGLDSSFASLLSSCAKKDFVTSHEAFGYLARDYGLNQIAISGVSPDEEPSPKELAAVTDYVKKNTIKVIFFETLVSPKLSETIAQETGAKTLVLNPLEGLSTEEIEEGKTYFTEMEQNLNNLHEALECK